MLASRLRLAHRPLSITIIDMTSTRAKPRAKAGRFYKHKNHAPTTEQITFKFDIEPGVKGGQGQYNFHHGKMLFSRDLGKTQFHAREPLILFYFVSFRFISFYSILLLYYIIILVKRYSE